jgi:hypothetical protein
MGNRTYDKYEYDDWYRKEYCCCDCGYVRNSAHHIGIRCPHTGRCGECGNDWPCEDHYNMVPEKLRQKVDSKKYVKED